MEEKSETKVKFANTDSDESDEDGRSLGTVVLDTDSSIESVPNLDLTDLIKLDSHTYGDYTKEPLESLKFDTQEESDLSFPVIKDPGICGKSCKENCQEALSRFNDDDISQLKELFSGPKHEFKQKLLVHLRTQENIIGFQSPAVHFKKGMLSVQKRWQPF